MNINRDTFLGWAHAHPWFEPLGVSNHPRLCPVANFLAHIHRRDVSVAAGEYSLYDLSGNKVSFPLPEELETIRRQIDSRRLYALWTRASVAYLLESWPLERVIAHALEEALTMLFGERKLFTQMQICEAMRITAQTASLYDADATAVDVFETEIEYVNREGEWTQLSLPESIFASLYKAVWERAVGLDEIEHLIQHSGAV